MGKICDNGEEMRGEGHTRGRVGVVGMTWTVSKRSCHADRVGEDAE